MWWKPAFGSLAASGIALVAAIILADHALAEPGRFYYDVRGGRLPDGAALDGTVHYGLGPAATVRTGLRMNGDEVAVEAGAVMNPFSFLSLSTSVEMPAWDWSVSAQAWRSGLNITGSWYRRNNSSSGMQLHLASLWGPLSISLAASSYRDVPHWQSHAVNPGLWLYLPGGQILRAMWQYELNRYGPELSDERHVWRVGAGLPTARARTFFNVGAQGNHWTLGLESFIALGSWSVGLTADINVTTGRVAGGIALQVNTPVAALAVRSHRTNHGWVHSQSLHGQVSVDRRLALGRDVHQESAARLVVFRDTNSNGIADPDEPVLPHIRVQMYHANWVRHGDGTLHAGHLEPFKTYQVRILEGSVTDPRLQPATGYTFSFVADPGQTKRIYVPMQPLLQISGRIINSDRPSSRLLVQVADGPGVSVYRDGGFTLMLKAGEHEVSVVDVLTDEELANQQVRVHAQSDIITIDLTKDRP